MTNNNENSIQLEQIKNITEDSKQFSDKLYSFLEKDEFNIFHTKSKMKMVKKLKLTDSKIQKLLDLKLRAEEFKNRQLAKKKKILGENLKLRKSLIEKLDLEID